MGRWALGSHLIWPRTAPNTLETPPLSSPADCRSTPRGSVSWILIGFQRILQTARVRCGDLSLSQGAAQSDISQPEGPGWEKNSWNPPPPAPLWVGLNQRLKEPLGRMGGCSSTAVKRSLGPLRASINDLRSQILTQGSCRIRPAFSRVLFHCQKLFSLGG